MLREIVLAIQSYFTAHKFISENKLWRWIIVPGIIYLILFLGGITLFWITANNAVQLLLAETGLKAWLDNMREGWLTFFVIMGQLIIWLIFLFLYFSIFKFIFLIIGSPLFAYLSEKSESLISGKDYPISLVQILKDSWRAIKLSFRNFFWQAFFLITVFIISFVPVVGWIAPLIAFMIECYYFGFAMLDYSFERHKTKSAVSISFISKHKGLAIGNGMMFFAMHLVPVIGWLLAPSYAVIAATLSLINYKYADKPILKNEQA